MNHCQRQALVGMLIVMLAVIFTSGCSSFVADREQGFTMMQRGFSELKPTPDLYKELTLEHVKVVIVGNRQQFNWSKAAAENSQILGYATPANEIWVFGKIVNGKIVVNEAVIGHELTHLLNFRDARVANPDTLRELNLTPAQKGSSRLSVEAHVR